jgi:hypothetical protein
LTAGSAGVLFYNNTILSETAAAGASNVHWRNNLILGENSSPVIFSVNTFTSYTSSDYNGFRANPGAKTSFQWTAPAAGKLADFSGMNLPAGTPGGATAPLVARQFATLAEYAQATGQDAHSVAVDYDIFRNVPRLDAQDRATVQKVYTADSLDFRLRPGSAAVDRGVALPNVSDTFAGRAPDLGALELDAPPPHYGPRP